MEKKTTRAHYIESLQVLLSANEAWKHTEIKSPERAEAYRQYENAMGGAQIRASRLGYHESQVYLDCMKIQEGVDV